MQVTADGKILVAGSRSCAGSCLSGRDGYVARYNPDGALDASFGAGGIKEIVIAANFDAIYDMAIDADGSIVATGQVTQNDMDRGNSIDSALVVRLKNTIGSAQVNLTVGISGSGSVNSSPVGINCGNVCVAAFALGTPVTLTAVTSGGSTFAGWSGAGCAGTGTCTITMTAATNITATFTGGTATLLGVQSRKTHGTVGVFDLAIDTTQPLGGLVTAEPRTIGSGHTIVFQFDSAISAAGTASVTPVGTATATFVGTEVLVTLTNIPDNRRATVSLANVNGSISPPAVSVGFLVGDVNNTRSVNSSDISGVKARSGQTTTTLNFKFDVNATGAINSSDISAVKARSGLTLP